MSTGSERYLIEVQGLISGPCHFLTSQNISIEITDTGSSFEITVRDQSELLGLLRQVRDYGLTLNRVQRLNSAF